MINKNKDINKNNNIIRQVNKIILGITINDKLDCK